MVEIFTTKTCTYCKKAKDYFAKNDISYVETDVTTNPVERERMVRHSDGVMAVPVIVVGEKALVGWDESKFKAAYEKESEKS